MSETDTTLTSDVFMRTFLGPALRAARAALVDAAVVLEPQRNKDGLWWQRGRRKLVLSQADSRLRLRLVATGDASEVDLLNMRLDPHAAAEGRVAPDAGCLAWALRMLHEDGPIGLPPSPTAVGAGVAALNGKLGAAPDGKTGARWRDEVANTRSRWSLRCSCEQRQVLLEFDCHAGAWSMTLDDKSVVDPTQDGVVAALTWLAIGDAAPLERAKRLRGNDLRVTPEERVLLGGGAQIPATSAQLLPDGSRAPVAVEQVRVNITGTRIEPQEGLCVMAVPPALRLHPRDLDRRPDDRRKLWKIGCYASLFESGHALVELPVRDDRTHPVPADERAQKLAEWLLKQLCPCCGEPLRHLNLHQEPDAFPPQTAGEDEGIEADIKNAAVPLPASGVELKAMLMSHAPADPVSVPNGLLYHHAGRKLAIVRESGAWLLRLWLSGDSSVRAEAWATLGGAAAALAFLRDGDYAHLATIRDCEAPAPLPVSQEDPMSNDAPKSPILESLKVDATDAAWRTAGSQFVKLARDPLCALIARHLAPEDESLRNKIAAFLQTEMGAAILASMLSLGLSAVPAAGQTGAVTERLGRELRVRAMADAGDLVAEIVMGPLRQVMSLYLQDPTGAPIAAAPAAPEPPALDAPERVAIGPTRVAAATRR